MSGNKFSIAMDLRSVRLPYYQKRKPRRIFFKALSAEEKVRSLRDKVPAMLQTFGIGKRLGLVPAEVSEQPKAITGSMVLYQLRHLRVLKFRRRIWVLNSRSIFGEHGRSSMSHWRKWLFVERRWSSNMSSKRQWRLSIQPRIGKRPVIISSIGGKEAGDS